VQVEVNGTRLWFDVDGPALVPDGTSMRSRPTVVLVHGGPGSYDHSYFKPHFDALTAHAQVLYVDLRDHGRSERHNPAEWTFEVCADDVHALCEHLGIERPILFGHSMGGIVAMLCGARHPGHPRALVLQSTMARFDLERLVEGFRRAADEAVAALARRAYDGRDVTDDEWRRVFAAFGPCVPDTDELARRRTNAAVGTHGMELLRRLDVRAALAHVTCPTLVSVGALDVVTPIEAAEEILAGLRPGVGTLEVLPGAGHFPWLDDPAGYWPGLVAFVLNQLVDNGRGLS
jgi:pimeloyl-ACP methyl ester carboxylesterase